MADKPTKILTSSEAETLRNEDENMETTGVIRSGTRIGWEGTKGAITGAAVGTGIGSAFALATFGAGTILIPAFAAGGALVAGAGNAIWGSLSKGSKVKEEEEA